MGQDLYASGTTTEVVRRAMKPRQESLSALATHYRIDLRTVAKGKKRSTAADQPTGLKGHNSMVLPRHEEPAMAAFRRYALLTLYHCL
jgi:hypothetical protein